MIEEVDTDRVYGLSLAMRPDEMRQIKSGEEEIKKPGGCQKLLEDDLH